MKVTYTRAQRHLALFYGLVSHTLFLTSVIVMFLSLYRGLSIGWVHLHGIDAWIINLALLVQFALGHSFLLSEKGRGLLERLAPLHLGKPLATTIFSALASLQLLLVFLL